MTVVVKRQLSFDKRQPSSSDNGSKPSSTTVAASRRRLLLRRLPTAAAVDNVPQQSPSPRRRHPSISIQTAAAGHFSFKVSSKSLN
jgi:hypothetical protein